MFDRLELPAELPALPEWALPHIAAVRVGKWNTARAQWAAEWPEATRLSMAPKVAVVYRNLIAEALDGMRAANEASYRRACALHAMRRAAHG